MIESRTCLLPMITPQSNFALRMHGHYQHRLLLHEGGLLDQPNAYLEAMEILSERAALIRAEQLEKDRRELARAGRSFPPQ